MYTTEAIVIVIDVKIKTWTKNRFTLEISKKKNPVKIAIMLRIKFAIKTKFILETKFPPLKNEITMEM